MKSYEDIFNHRANPYHRAMQQFPSARDAEFQALFQEVTTFDNIRKILDVPAGGGYLKRYLPDHVELLELEFSQEFIGQTKSGTITKVEPENIELEHCDFDIGVSLAALHHVDDKQTFITSLLKGMAPGGRLCIGDVLDESKEAVFLDEFVSQYNGTGHDGNYLADCQRQLAGLGSDIGQLVRHQYQPCPWQFTDEQSLLTFVRLLFGLNDLTDNRLLNELEQQIGISQKADLVCLNWALLYVDYTVDHQKFQSVCGRCSLP